MRMTLLCMVILLIASPIWPLGKNPIVGDPFVIVNVETKQLAFIHEGEIKEIYDVAIGKKEEASPLGTFTVTVKAENPYYRKKNIKGGAKENPLGTRWIGFDANDTDGRTYGIHGTNNPNSIGHAVTAGCIRLHNEAVELLYDRIPLGTKVHITNSEKTFQHIGETFGALVIK